MGDGHNHSFDGMVQSSVELAHFGREIVELQVQIEQRATMEALPQNMDPAGYSGQLSREILSPNLSARATLRGMLMSLLAGSWYLLSMLR